MYVNDSPKLLLSITITYGFSASRFCLTHGTPEVHGCGEAAKVQARINISKEGKIYSGESLYTLCVLLA